MPLSASRNQVRKLDSTLAKLSNAGFYVEKDWALPDEKQAYIVSTASGKGEKGIPKEVISSKFFMALNRSLISETYD